MALAAVSLCHRGIVTPSSGLGLRPAALNATRCSRISQRMYKAIDQQAKLCGLAWLNGQTLHFMQLKLGNGLVPDSLRPASANRSVCASSCKQGLGELFCQHGAGVQHVDAIAASGLDSALVTQ